MRNFIYLISFLLLADKFLFKCANPGNPTGGPKDTIPPTVISTFPENGSVNFDDNELILEFSEYITGEKIRNNLIITPNIDIKYKYIEKKNILIMKLESELEDSTTYNFNFSNGVTDITEKNSAENVTLAFSTGPSIDSLEISGSIKDLFMQEPVKKYIIGLYNLTDSLNLLTDPPTYFTMCNDSGKYALGYIKANNYRLLAFNDENKNLILEPETEQHAFISDTIELDSNTVVKDIYSLLQDIRPVKLVNHRSFGHYYQIKYNKRINQFSILNNDTIPGNIIGDDKNTIRLYNKQKNISKDSILLVLETSDSLMNSSLDTIKIAFLESNRDKDKFKVFSDIDNKSINIKLSKPSEYFNIDGIKFNYDSILFYQPSIDSINYNDNRDEISIYYNLKIDSIERDISEMLPKDTIYSDSNSYNLVPKSINNPELILNLSKGTIISVEGDSSENISKSILYRNVIDKSKFGILRITPNTNHESYEVQLLDKLSNVKYKAYQADEIVFSSIEPNEYRIRILIDSNNDGSWSYGNLLQGAEPEKVYLHPDKYSIRENFIIEESITF